MSNEQLKRTIRTWIDNQTSEDADTCLMSIVDHLFATQDDVADPACLQLCLTALSNIVRQTWWRCSCSSVNPICGEVDAICPECGTLRRLPPRLSFPVWTAYVMTAKRLFPDDWFSRLFRWSQARGLLAAPCVDGSAHEGVAAYCSDAAIDAQGETSPSQDTLIYVDNMRVCHTGETIATNWIALELPDFDTFNAL